MKTLIKSREKFGNDKTKKNIRNNKIGLNDMVKKTKKLTRINNDKETIQLQVEDLQQLGSIFIKTCGKLLELGKLDDVAKVVSLMKEIDYLKNNKLTYERSFIMKHLERHGLLGTIFSKMDEEYPMLKEEAEELKEMFGDQIEDIKELIG